MLCVQMKIKMTVKIVKLVNTVLTINALLVMTVHIRM